MSTQEAIEDTRYRCVKVGKFRSSIKVKLFDDDEENAQINDDCAARSQKCLKVKPDPVVAASNDDAAPQGAAADLDARRKQVFEQFEIERKLIVDELQHEEMITANCHNSDHLHRARDLSCLRREQKFLDACVDNRSKGFSSPNVEKGVQPQLESSKPYEEVLEECHCEDSSQSAILAQASENRPHVNEFSLLSNYLPSALADRGISSESELDRLSRQVQVLVHQLAGCRKNLLRAEIEVGVLHEENRELKCLIKDLLAVCSCH